MTKPQLAVSEDKGESDKVRESNAGARTQS
jgi:hypothetical protein